MKKQSKKTQKKEKVCETFEVSDGTGGEKEEISCGNLEEKHSTKKEQNNFNLTLRNVLIFLGFLVILFLVIFLSLKYSKITNYEGVEFQKIKDGSVTFYHASFSSVASSKVTYNAYIRNNPKVLSKSVLSNYSELKLNRLVLLNYSLDDTACDGDDVIARANFIQIMHDGLNYTVGKNDTISCDKFGRYTYFNLVQGNTTKIEQIGPACYTLEFANCEVLKVTERVLIEAIAESNSK